MATASDDDAPAAPDAEAARSESGGADEQEGATTSAAEPESTDNASARISKFVSEAYASVPEAGKGRRWYDLPYRLLDWSLRSWRRRLLPTRARARLNYYLNYLLSFHSYDIDKAWSREDPLHNLFVPPDEHVTMPSLWVVELFPPSEFAALSRAIERNGWDRRRVQFGTGESNRDMLERARARSGWSWWALGTLARANSGYTFPDGVLARLPDPFAAIELMALQIGPALTAVVAHFRLTDDAATQVDAVWHRPHEPRLLRAGGGRPRAENRLWAAYGRTQEHRKSLHDAARAWMARRCPGFFAANDEPQSVIDLLLLDKHDPLTERREPGFGDSLRALGLTEQSYLHISSTDLPGLLLTPVDPQLCPTFKDDRTWALVGSRQVAAAATEHLDMYGGDDVRALSFHTDRSARRFFVTLATSDLLDVLGERYAHVRDTARSQHGRFSVRDLKRLRSTFLSMSLDLTALARDLEIASNRGWRDEGDARFTVDYAPWIFDHDRTAGKPVPEPRDFNEQMQERLQEGLERLHAVDHEHREILSTVASLGTSVGTLRVGRVALLVSISSLAVALVALLTAGK